LACKTYGKIGLVSVDKQDGTLELLFAEHTVKFLLGLLYTLAIIAVNDEDDGLSVLVVVAPERANLVLTSDVPDGKV